MNPKQFVDDLRESLRAYKGDGSDDEVIQTLATLYCNLLEIYERAKGQASSGYVREKPETTPHLKLRDPRL